MKQGEAESAQLQHFAEEVRRATAADLVFILVSGEREGSEDEIASNAAIGMGRRFKTRSRANYSTAVQWLVISADRMVSALTGGRGRVRLEVDGVTEDLPIGNIVRREKWGGGGGES